MAINTAKGSMTQYAYTKAGPFDAKMLVKTKAELTQAATWIPQGGSMPVHYAGMIVSVNSDTIAENNGVYILKNSAFSNADNWVRLCGIDEIAILKLELEEKIKNEAGQQGETGKSAYDIWKEAGNDGDEAAFLASLIGPTGPQGEVGLTGPTGPQGEQGIQGDKGDKGDQGDIGPTGPQGPKGDTGATGPQGEIGPTGPQGPAGERGEKGEPGVSSIKLSDIKSDWSTVATGDIYLTQEVNEFATLTGDQNAVGVMVIVRMVDSDNKANSTVDYIGKLTGEQGPKGDTGATGPQGPQGPTGAQGPKGDQGTGVNIKASEADCIEIGDAYIDADGNIQIVTSIDPKYFTNGGQVKGPKGDTGDKGDKGDTGAIGPTGPAGSDATVTKAAVEDALTGIITTHEHYDDTIKLSADIWTDKTIGYINGTTTAPKKVAEKGDTLKTMFTNIFGTIEDDSANLVTNPAITAVSIGSSSYEYGTELDQLNVTITAKAGSYKYGPDVKGASWNGNYMLSGNGFTSKADSTANSQTVTLTNTFVVGTSSALTLNVSRSYDNATNTAQSKMGNSTDQAIEAGTASKSGTFDPTAVKYVYWAKTTSTAVPDTWTKYGNGQTAVTDLQLSCAAGEYIWVAATTNATSFYAWNDASGKYNTDELATTKLSNRTITNSQGVEASDYYIYRTTNNMLQAVDTKFRLA